MPLSLTDLCKWLDQHLPRTVKHFNWNRLLITYTFISHRHTLHYLSISHSGRISVVNQLYRKIYLLTINGDRLAFRLQHHIYIYDLYLPALFSSRNCYLVTVKTPFSGVSSHKKHFVSRPSLFSKLMVLVGNGSISVFALRLRFLHGDVLEAISVGGSQPISPSNWLHGQEVSPPRWEKIDEAFCVRSAYSPPNP